MKQQFVRYALLVGALLLLLWPPAVMLFAGPIPDSNALVGRGIALAVLACTYLLPVALLLFAIKRLALQLSRRARVALSAVVGALVALSLPLSALPVLFAIRALCNTLAACEGRILHLVPHAFYVAADYPAQLPLLPALLIALLYLSFAAAQSTVAERSNGA
jgi:hypothetical protein